ncbi:MAG: glycosyltransferase family 2 protein [Marinilabiliales bacterium]|nr:MAG: glycosyltransferase family 2 protein [Marinilabiliales bacterium]
MTSCNQKKIGVISMARNDRFFVDKWIDYYGLQFGPENLFLILDGHDQPLPERHGSINVLRLPHRKFSRAQGDRNRARLVSHLARALFHRYDIIIAHDIDEFLVVDPNQDQTLAAYLQRPLRSASLSALGLDVGQHTGLEPPIDPERPFLEQRSYAHVSARYTKPVVAAIPLTWGSGFHRVKGRNFHIDPNLFLFHFGMVDHNISMNKTGDQSLLKAGWSGHLDRRNQLFDLISKKTAIDGDEFFRTARRRQSLFRPFFALNKPGMLSEKPVIKIPERFRTVL